MRAINKGLKDAIADTDAAIEAVARRNRGIDRKANRERLLGTIGLEMGHPDGLRDGLGDADDARLAGIARLICETKGYPAPPQPHEIFRREFLPPQGERARVPAR